MPVRRVTFIGNPGDPQDARPKVEAFGEVYLLMRPRTVTLTDAVLKKLEKNSHFQVEDVEDSEKTLTKRLDSVAENIALKGEPDEDPNIPTDDNGNPTETAAPDAEPAPIQIRRERPRAGKPK